MQIVNETPTLRERLGDVPVAVVEKGKAPGAHLLSGAVVNPRAFRQLFPGLHSEDMPFIAPVEREGVYYLTRGRAQRIPAPPTMWNHGNFVASIGEVARWLAERAEQLGVTIVPETAAHKLLVTGGRAVGIRTGDRGRGERRGAPELRARLRPHRSSHDPRRRHQDTSPPSRTASSATRGSRRPGRSGSRKSGR